MKNEALKNKVNKNTVFIGGRVSEKSRNTIKSH